MTYIKIEKVFIDNFSKFQFIQKFENNKLENLFFRKYYFKNNIIKLKHKL